jgi:hypothetical protein
MREDKEDNASEGIEEIKLDRSRHLTYGIE